MRRYVRYGFIAVAYGSLCFVVSFCLEGDNKTMAVFSLVSGLLPNIVWPVRVDLVEKRVEEIKLLITKAGERSEIDADPYEIGVAALKNLEWSANAKARVERQISARH